MNLEEWKIHKGDIIGTLPVTAPLAAGVMKGFALARGIDNDTIDALAWQVPLAGAAVSSYLMGSAMDHHRNPSFTDHAYRVAFGAVSMVPYTAVVTGIGLAAGAAIGIATNYTIGRN